MHIEHVYKRSLFDGLSIPFFYEPSLFISHTCVQPDVKLVVSCLQLSVSAAKAVNYLSRDLSRILGRAHVTVSRIRGLKFTLF